MFSAKIPTKVLLKGGRTLDALAVATGVAFDKSGGSETPWDDSRSLYSSSTSIGETGIGSHALYIYIFPNDYLPWSYRIATVAPENQWL